MNSERLGKQTSLPYLQDNYIKKSLDSQFDLSDKSNDDNPIQKRIKIRLSKETFSQFIKIDKTTQINPIKPQITIDRQLDTEETSHQEIKKPRTLIHLQSLRNLNSNKVTQEKDNAKMLTNRRKQLSLISQQMIFDQKISQRNTNFLPARVKQQQQKDSLPQLKKENSNLEEISLFNQITQNPFRHLIFSPQVLHYFLKNQKVNEIILKKHLLSVQKGLQYAKRHLKGPSDALIKSMSVLIKPELCSKSKTIFLDLDETLIHSCNIFEQPDYVVEAQCELGQAKIPIKIRPYCEEFLRQNAANYNIFIFTASSDNYASAIVNFLDKERKYIKGYYTREHCMETKNGLFIKDLRIFQNLQLQNTLIVDNLSHSFGLQIPNGIPILEWKSDRSDQELLYLAEYLKEASRQQDLQTFNNNRLKLLDIIDFKVE